MGKNDLGDIERILFSCAPDMREEHLPLKDSLVLVAEKEGKLIGYAEICPPEGHYFFVRSLIVDEPYQRKMTAYRLLEAIAHICKWAGCVYYRGSVRKDNERMNRMATRFKNLQSYPEKDGKYNYYKVYIEGNGNVHTH